MPGRVTRPLAATEEPVWSPRRTLPVLRRRKVCRSTNGNQQHIDRSSESGKFNRHCADQDRPHSDSAFQNRRFCGCGNPRPPVRNQLAEVVNPGNQRHEGQQISQSKQVALGAAVRTLSYPLMDRSTLGGAAFCGRAAARGRS